MIWILIILFRIGLNYVYRCGVGRLLIRVYGGLVFGWFRFGIICGIRHLDPLSFYVLGYEFLDGHITIKISLPYFSSEAI